MKHSISQMFISPFSRIVDIKTKTRWYWEKYFLCQILYSRIVCVFLHIKKEKRVLWRKSWENESNRYGDRCIYFPWFHCHFWKESRVNSFPSYICMWNPFASGAGDAEGFFFLFQKYRCFMTKLAVAARVELKWDYGSDFLRIPLCKWYSWSFGLA